LTSPSFFREELTGKEMEKKYNKYIVVIPEEDYLDNQQNEIISR